MAINLGPAVRLGWLEVRPVGHLLAVLGLWLVVLALSGTSHVGLVLLGYVLLVAPRLQHELGHALVGRWCGRRVERLVWTPLASYVRFGEAARGRAGRLSALAGPLSQAAAGGVLLVILIVAGYVWSTTIQELVLLLAALHLVGLANLLPVPGLDGRQVFGWAWPLRLVWLAQLAALVVPVLLVPLLVIWRFPAGFLHATLGGLPPVVESLELLVLAIVVVAIPEVMSGSGSGRLLVELPVRRRAELFGQANLALRSAPALALPCRSCLAMETVQAPCDPRRFVGVDSGITYTATINSAYKDTGTATVDLVGDRNALDVVFLETFGTSNGVVPLCQDNLNDQGNQNNQGNGGGNCNSR
jgi:hypothetical protein